MTIPQKRQRTHDLTDNALRRLMSISDWAFEDFPEQTFFSEPWTPAVDLKENKKSYVVHADLPGVDPKDIDITLENGILAIRGERKSERREEGDDFHRVERFSGSFTRQFSLPDAADDGVEAKMKDGVLEVRIPKSGKTTKARKIEIK
jgi:HSP20 family protein